MNAWIRCRYYHAVQVASVCIRVLTSIGLREVIARPACRPRAAHARPVVLLDTPLRERFAYGSPRSAAGRRPLPSPRRGATALRRAGAVVNVFGIES